MARKAASQILMPISCYENPALTVPRPGVTQALWIYGADHKFRLACGFELDRRTVRLLDTTQFSAADWKSALSPPLCYRFARHRLH